jgi:hypothetical protein
LKVENDLPPKNVETLYSNFPPVWENSEANHLFENEELSFVVQGILSSPGLVRGILKKHEKNEGKTKERKKKRRTSFEDGKTDHSSTQKKKAKKISVSFPH